MRHCVRRLTLDGDAPASKKGGSLPPPAPLSCGAPLRRARGDTRGAASLSFSAADAGNPCCPASDAAFRGSPPPQRGGGAPSEREALWVLKACATYVRHQVFVSGALIRRHRLDPQRRKLSTHPAPAEAASWLLSTAVPLLPLPSPRWHGCAPPGNSEAPDTERPSETLRTPLRRFSRPLK